MRCCLGPELGPRPEAEPELELELELNEAELLINQGRRTAEGSQGPRAMAARIHHIYYGTGHGDRVARNMRYV